MGASAIGGSDAQSPEKCAQLEDKLNEKHEVHSELMVEDVAVIGNGLYARASL